MGIKLSETNKRQSIQHDQEAYMASQRDGKNMNVRMKSQPEGKIDMLGAGDANGE